MTELEKYVEACNNLENQYRNMRELIEELKEEIEKLQNDINNAIAKCNKGDKNDTNKSF